ncbi:uncharacterized protein LOC122671571 isoform X2 [Telopea speciosissima]|uniref:uncharacterized protein LOC122671571 isoform X2 n=1 Tax=Telopea speciosissima TaxID=54955 RepID=UPI001CC7D5AC|nr:uncharacterized protein LOC122671571 isoform X2 [Telopea speciosissima]
MLDGLLGRGFTSKCKSSIKLISARIDVIRRKRKAMQKFLKKDVADLLGNGLDINAYGRAEGLLVELNLSSCYDLVEQFCLCILKQISVMQKQRECPEECREAIPSLMFAAARFADLPELRDLRQLFSERYGNSLESFVNQEFAEKMAAKPPTKEKKLQLMRDIAKEFSIKWDSKAFDQKMSNPPAAVQDQSKKQGFFHGSDDGYKLRKMEDTVPEIDTQDVSSRGRRELTHDGYKSHSHREDTVPKNDSSRGRREHGYKSHSHREDTIPKIDNHAILSDGRREFSDDGRKPHNSRGDNQDVSTRGRRELTDNGYKLRKEREDIMSKRDNHDVSSRGCQEITSDKHKPYSNREEDSLLRREHQDLSSHGRREVSDAGYKPKRDNLYGLADGGWEHTKDTRKQCNGGEDTVLENYNGGISTHGRVGVTPISTRRRQVKTDGIDVSVAIAGDKQNGSKNHSYSINKFTEENTETLKPFCNNIVPPPYIKPRETKYGTNSEAQRTSSDNNEFSSDPPNSNRDVMRKNSERTEKRLDRVDYAARVNGYGDEKDHHWNDLVDDAKPKPKSVRRRHLKPPPGHEIVNSEREEAAKRNPSVRKEDARRGLQTLFDDDSDSKYEEEKIDKLLLHYSKKPSTYEPSKMRKGYKAPPSHDTAADASRRPRHRRRDEAHLNTGLGHPPARAVSLPPEPTAPTELPRAPARASSFQPDGHAGHVHPKLPDCDDLAARVAALRGM